jgi:HK97 family phage major capsid protein
MKNEKIDQVQDLLDLKAVEAQLEANHDALEGFIEKSNGEIEATKTISVETKSAMDKLAQTVVGLGDQIATMEQAQVKHFDEGEESKSLGEMLVDSDGFKTFVQNRRGMAEIEVKTAIVNAVPSMVQPITPGHRLPGVVVGPDRALRIRDILPSGVTNSNIVWFSKEDTFTNAAAVQVGTSSPIIVAENIALGESAMTFTSDSEEVKTIGHWIPVSLNALEDSDFLSSYVDSRLRYGLAYKVDTELLVGTGLIGTIEGIYTGRTAYTVDSPADPTTKLDVLRDAKAQAHQTDYEPDFVVLNPGDWASIEMSKETNGMYIFSHPAGEIAQVIWGMRVVLSNSMAAGTFLVGASQSAQVWSRRQAMVSIAYENGTDFVKEMATLKASERLALTIYNKGGLIGGSFAVTA